MDNSNDNFLVVSTIAEIQDEEQYLLLSKPTNQHPDGHSGGQPISIGTEPYEQLELFVGRINEIDDDCATDVNLSDDDSDSSCDNDNARRLLRRLSHVEYDNTIQDLFGLSGSWANDFASDNVSHGYDNNAVALQVSPLLLDQYANEPLKRTKQRTMQHNRCRLFTRCVHKS